MPISEFIRKEPLWKPIAQQRLAIDPPYREWIADSGSLTKKLVSKAKEQFSVSVLKQSIQAIPLSEQALLNTPHRQWGLIREVLLYGVDTPWVYARTAIPLNTLHGPLRRLHYLGNRPLGEQLFTDPTMRRGHIEAAEIFPHHVPKNILSNEGVTKKTTWGRRSVFYLSSKPLLVSEIFLPTLINENHL